MTGLRVQIASFNANLQGADATRPDLTPWLVPAVHQPAIDNLASSSTPATKPSSPLPAHHFRSTNPNTPSSHPSLPREAPDFYAVGFQELVPLHSGFAATSGLALYNTDLDIRKTLRPHQAVVSGNGMYAEAHLGGGPESYALLCRVDLVGIALFVYARERPPFAAAPKKASAASRVKEIRKATVGTGLGGLMGNKGAVGVRLVVASPDGTGQDEVLTFVTAHLAAHDHNVERRNTDWRQIVQRLVFEPSSVSRLPIVQDANVKTSPTNLDALQQQYHAANPASSKAKIDRTPRPLDTRSYTLYDSTHLFVFGDLNHRIALGPTSVPGASSAQPLTKQRLASLLDSKDWASLQPHDQLTQQRLASSAKAFHALTEVSIAEMNVPPTYKYKVVRDGEGTPSKKQKKAGKAAAAAAAAASAPGQELSTKRIPGWTDRVLWASAAAAGPSSDAAATYDKQGVEVELFRSVMEMTHSDHKPVTTLLQLPRPNGKAGNAPPLLSSHNPYPPLSAPHRYILSLIGFLLDRAVGYLWTAIILLGGGNLIGGAVEVVVLGAITAWWLSRGGGEGGGDLSWWIYGSSRS
ncbi:uncharacterized protein PFL1_00629 [Pseudozyma flocculosa PF-1]|uniref:Related to INP54 - Phosphatidylinositol 4,5-bisphosphate 5-phosphatase n=1 Tax=Pseudozyma flocculosa TaxID=84751 RepID=A0A5C3EQK6_9BASI|nr:uncharacterized protein PFL1_00629 [Pseudozyma flocculosa PF-1]EPQ32433.1 hypothetical protein PFL1_00629 [Pseudozyma flocculosa PF-1]SPO34583.1 related to INP54 - Phosphatidylinositol 4,5-bisphosphate 5-phosphatase [Pseudozyma flocculosa]